MRLIGRLAVACIAALVAGFVQAQDIKVPELLAGFEPVAGFVPVQGAEPAKYRFDVFAVDIDDSSAVLVTADAFVGPGQTRKVHGHRGEWTIDGTVTVAESGRLMYRVSLLRNGTRVTSSSASLSQPKGE